MQLSGCWTDVAIGMACGRDLDLAPVPGLVWLVRPHCVLPPRSPWITPADSPLPAADPDFKRLLITCRPRIAAAAQEAYTLLCAIEPQVGVLENGIRILQELVQERRLKSAECETFIGIHNPQLFAEVQVRTCFGGRGGWGRAAAGGAGCCICRRGRE